MLLGRPGLSPVMVGREAELHSLRQLLGNGAGTRLAMVSGEAGVGKTRLVRELAASASGVVLTGQASEGQGRPFSVFLDAVEPLVGTWSEVPHELSARAGALAAMLGPAVPRVATAPDQTYAQEDLLRAGVDLVGHL